MAIEECQNQFAFSRWNCTTFPDKNNTFGNVATISKLIYVQSCLSLHYNFLSRKSRSGLPKCDIGSFGSLRSNEGVYKRRTVGILRLRRKNQVSEILTGSTVTKVKTLGRKRQQNGNGAVARTISGLEKDFPRNFWTSGKIVEPR